MIGTAPFATYPQGEIPGDWHIGEEGLDQGMGSYRGYACLGRAVTPLSTRSLATTVGGHKPGQPPYATCKHIEPDPEITLACSTSCYPDAKTRPMHKPIVYKEPEPVDNYARAYLNPVPYATHSNVNTHRSINNPHNKPKRDVVSLSARSSARWRVKTPHASTQRFTMGKNSKGWEEYKRAHPHTGVIEKVRTQWIFDGQNRNKSKETNDQNRIDSARSAASNNSFYTARNPLGLATT